MSLKLGLYSIHDACSNAFSNPWVARTNDEAIRAFGRDTKKTDSAAADHPEDFFLYHVGYFDQVSGRIEGLEIVERISKATDFINHTEKK